MTRFSYLNLVADPFPTVFGDTQSMDLILCRNVFIYFQQDVVSQVMAKFRDCLLTDGILMLGASDPVRRDVENLRFEQQGEVMIYRHCLDAKIDASTPVSTRAACTSDPVEPLPDEAFMVPEPTSGADEIVSDPAEVLEALRRKEWATALARADRQLLFDPENADLLQLRASAYANLGRLEEAAKDCLAAISLKNTDKHVHFLHGLVLTELNRSAQAIDALRKALFLDSAFIEAHYQLGLLLLGSGQRQQGVKSLGNALRLAESASPEQRLHGAADMTYGRLAEVLRQEISVYESV